MNALNVVTYRDNLQQSMSVVDVDAIDKDLQYILQVAVSSF